MKIKKSKEIKLRIYNEGKRDSMYKTKIIKLNRRRSRER